MNKEYISDNLIAVPAEEELENIDALLRDFADEETAKVDFEAIKARAFASARAKRLQRKSVCASSPMLRRRHACSSASA